MGSINELMKNRFNTIAPESFTDARAMQIADNRYNHPDYIWGNPWDGPSDRHRPVSITYRDQLTAECHSDRAIAEFARASSILFARWLAMNYSTNQLNQVSPQWWKHTQRHFHENVLPNMLQDRAVITELLM